MASKERGLWFHILDVLFNIIVIVAVVALIRTFLVAPFEVEGSSMDDTLRDREYIIINKLAYYIGYPQRGDVVVFNPPGTDHGKYYVKRVIGEPGDEVIIQDGYVYLRKNRESEVRKLEEDYLSDRNRGKTFRHPPSSGDRTKVVYDVPQGFNFVLGDNRMGSSDSRGFMVDGKPEPFVPRNDIKGKVWFVALPVTKIHMLVQPQYGF
ncbi:signal peptidase I [Candidatus Peregrinibacteria bacterium]|nr:signal peptidase I [Candidatus Peregrinibacteria bacterium]